MKRTHKLQELGDAASVVQSASSVAAAAKRLGVTRCTVYRWIKHGRVPKPSGLPEVKEPVTPEMVTGGLTAEAWAVKVRADREFDATGSALLDLAVGALQMAVTGNPTIRLSAMTRFQALVKQLRLDGAVETDASEQKAPEPVRVPTVCRVTHDPRHILQAVK